MEIVEIKDGVIVEASENVLIVDWDEIQKVRIRFENGGEIVDATEWRKGPPSSVIYADEIRDIERLIEALLWEGEHSLTEDILAVIGDALNAADKLGYLSEPE